MVRMKSEKKQRNFGTGKSALMKLAERTVAYVRGHRCLAMSIVFAALFIAIAILPLSPVNINYEAKFDRAISKNAVTFVFEAYKPKPSLGKQPATSDGMTVSIRVDPVNYSSSTLAIKIKTKESNVRLTSFDAVVRSNGRDWYTAASLPAGAFYVQNEDGVTAFRVESQKMGHFNRLIRQKSALKLGLIAILVMLYLLIIGRMTVFSRVRQDYFAASSVVAVGVIVFLFYLWFGRAGLTTSRFPYKMIISGLLAMVILLIAISNCVQKLSVGKRKLTCIANYIFAAFFTIGQFAIYLKYYSHSNDEMGHLSYVAYERVHNQLVPRFEDIRIYSDAVNPTGHISLSDAVQFNQLGHPPLYYLIMSHMPGITNVGPEVTYHLGLLRCESFALGFAGILLCFYLGYTRIPKIPLLHLLYALVIVSPPNLVFIMSGLNNDTLAFTCVTIFVLGCVRFIERRYTLSTFLLVAVGIASTLLTKLTAGMIVCSVALLVVVYSLLREHATKSILRKEFIWSLPVYALPVAYYATLITRYGTVQPSYQKLALSEYLSGPFYTPIAKRLDMSLSQYLVYYWTNFVHSWCAIPYASDIQRPTLTAFGLDSIAITCVLLLPLILVVCAKGRLSKYIALGVAGTWLVMLYQFWSALNGFYQNGYAGAFQSRYYLCAIAIFAFAIIALILQHFAKPAAADNALGCTDFTLTVRGKWFCSVFVLMLVVDGYVCSFLYHAPELTIFAS